MKKAVIFIGIQASGKTTFYKNNFEGVYEHISLDVLHTRNKEQRALEECFSQGKSFVIDNTNPTRADRTRYIGQAKQQGYEIVGYYFQSCIAPCIERNEQREGKARVPDKAIVCTSKKLELPELSEGFDALYYVHMRGQKTFVEEWRN